ncbi:hypothetical protein LCGC14_0757960 [marine sediment metagenome]|uniref:UTP--glucose-1-phosphate uridylyltransferase n=1 Tax=marine sediment metagenome TaxID=412755 RepID=A0A0F9SMB9_9ZZZZ
MLCAGMGRRLLPYTKNTQKTMLLIHGKPLLEYILIGLIFAGFREIIFVVGYKKEQIIDFFKDGKKWNVHLEYIEQKKLNGTGGALLLCKNLIKTSHFFLTWGDTLVPYSVYKEVFNRFKKGKNDFVLVTNYSNDPHKGGAVYIKNNYCIDIIEKPPKGKSKSNLNNCGVFIFSIEIFEVLNNLKPSVRGEIELPEALRIGIFERNWKIYIIKMEPNQFRGDCGDKKIYERLRLESNWLKELDGSLRLKK